MLQVMQRFGTLSNTSVFPMHSSQSHAQLTHTHVSVSPCSFVTVSDLVSDMRDQSFPYTSYQRNLESAYLCSALKYSCTKFSISILTPTTHNTHLSDSTFSAGIKIVSCSLCLFCYSGLYLHSANRGIHMSALQVLWLANGHKYLHRNHIRLCLPFWCRQMHCYSPETFDFRSMQQKKIGNYKQWHSYMYISSTKHTCSQVTAQLWTLDHQIRLLAVQLTLRQVMQSHKVDQ